mmetsp:Transcript_226/g.550  ORF Transcript_226/g.550 Transcript_226/m.550 type:complete len:394 (+) Transcript_226:157-1338(+)
MESSSPSSLLRVLCLHDAGSNSLELSQKLDSLGKQLYQKHGIDLVFVDAPLIVENATRDSKNGASNDGSEDSNRPSAIQDHPPRAWWEIEKVPFALKRRTRKDVETEKNEGDGSDSNETEEPDPDERSKESETIVAAPSPPRYVGLDASLLLLRQIWTSSPFWGVLAVGQAAGVASILPLLPSSDGKQQQQPAFIIFVNGGTLLEGEEILIDIPCLHIVDNHLITSPQFESARRLVCQFGGQVVCDESLSPRSMRSSSSAAFNNHVGRFLVAHKKFLRRNIQDITVLALRHELHQTEADVARFVANHIAENPPDALMAAITPKDIGGFQDRRRGPDEDGGGAPCPSEFLLQRTKRSTTKSHQTTSSSSKDDASSSEPKAKRDSEASRHHPNQH